MTFLDHLRRMAAYNALMNDQLYAAAARLPPAEVARHRGAFFGSILGTFNHLVVTDLLWLRRFLGQPQLAAAIGELGDLPAPSRLDQTIHADLGDLTALRARLDVLLSRAVAGLDPDFDFDAPLRYQRADGTPQEKPVGVLLAHVFNHQTHHRGQVSTLFSQLGVDIGVTDLQALEPSRL